jgi:dihydrofolate reductase
LAGSGFHTGILHPDSLPDMQAFNRNQKMGDGQLPMQKISLIAAMSDNRVIGRKNALPWKMPADLEHFRKTTEGHPFIMGRKSYLSRDRLLSNNLSIILTHHTTDYLYPNCIRAESLGEALSILGDVPEIFILGGGEVFRQALPIANHMYLTRIHANIKGDTFFPEFDSKEWKIISESHHQKDPENPYDYSFIEYTR